MPDQTWCKKLHLFSSGGLRVMVFNATFNNISVLSWHIFLKKYIQNNCEMSRQRGFPSKIYHHISESIKNICDVDYI
jgi:hypothetical protein